MHRKLSLLVVYKHRYFPKTNQTSNLAKLTEKENKYRNKPTKYCFLTIATLHRHNKL